VICGDGIRAIETILFVLQHPVDFREQFGYQLWVLLVFGLLAEVHPPFLLRSIYGTSFGTHVAPSPYEQ
jgi:hypothetical protein